MTSWDNRHGWWRLDWYKVTVYLAVMQPCAARLYEGDGPVAYPPRLVGPCRATVCRERAGASRGLCSRSCGARTFCALSLPWATLLPPRKAMSELFDLLVAAQPLPRGLFLH